MSWFLSWSCCDVDSVCVCLLILFLLCLLPPEKLDEMLAGGQQEVVLRARPSDDFRAATVKQRPTSRRITQAEINVRRDPNPSIDSFIVKHSNNEKGGVIFDICELIINDFYFTVSC